MAAPTVAWPAPGAWSWSAATTASDPAYPASGVVAGDAIFCVTLSKATTGTGDPPSAADPSGWTTVLNEVFGSGTAGTTAGRIRCQIIQRNTDADGSENGVTLTNLVSTPSGASMSFSALFGIRRDHGGALSLASTSGTDSTSGTGFSVTGAADPGVTLDDLMIVFAGLATQSGTSASGETLTTTGITYGSITEGADNATSSGNDVRAVSWYAPVTAGTATAAPVAGATLAAASIGGAMFMRVREAAGGTTFTKDLAGSVSSAGALVKQSNSALSGSISSAGSLAKQMGKAAGGAVSSSGVLTLTRLIVVALAGAISMSGLLTRQTSKAAGGTATPSGSVTKNTLKALAGAVASVGALTLTRLILRSFAGSISLAGSLTKLSNKALAGAGTPAGAITKRPAKAVGGVVSPAGALTISRVFLRTLVGSIGPTGALALRTAKALAGVVAPSGALQKRDAKTVSGGISLAGALARARIVTLALSGTLSAVGSLAKRTSKATGGTVGPAGSLAKRVATALRGVLDTLGVIELALNPNRITVTQRIRRAGRLGISRVVGCEQGGVAGREPPESASGHRDGGVSGQEQGPISGMEDGT